MDGKGTSPNLDEDEVHEYNPIQCACSVDEYPPDFDRAALEQEATAIVKQWPAMESIATRPTPFPIASLPELLQDWVAAIAESTQTPPDLAAALALAVVATTVQRKFRVQVTADWSEPLSLYTATVLEPGNRKTAVFERAVAPLKAIENELVASGRERVALAASQRRRLQTQLAQAERASASGDFEASELANELALRLENTPEAYDAQIITDDATTEALVQLMKANQGRIACLSDEGGVFSLMSGRYSGKLYLEPYLAGHAGGSIRVNRVGRKSIHVEQAALTMGLAIQPDVLNSLAKESAFHGRGLLARFLYCVPHSTIGHRRIDPPGVPNIIQHLYAAKVRSLWQTPWKIDGTPHRIAFDDAGLQSILDWSRQIEADLADGGRLEAIREWGAKLAGLTARIAALLHLFSVDTDEEVPLNITVGLTQAAIEIAQYAISHAEIAFCLTRATQDQSSSDADYVLRWIVGKRLANFSRRDVHAHGRGRFDRERDRLSAALQLLESTHHIRKASAPPRKSSGQPPSPRYDVHPLLLAHYERART